ncbi:hypothetical protein TCON_2134 [Astathelohania contejeani]|uniref:FAR-17a/AIG1-like protein n=1 Tax=Astathelohania contejeani TaxID=164912 RepID=A0ABQ7HWW1_9MICR|nr:hypothetical protein TCON_2134 [Thelohania contejeani]
MFLFTAKAIGLFLCMYAGSEWSMPKEMIKALEEAKIGRLQFLTIIGLYFTILTLFQGLIINILYKNTRTQSRINRALNNIYSFSMSIVLPLEMIITVFFWILNFINPKLLFHEDMYKRNIHVSAFTNLCLHLFPLILLLLNLLEIDINRCYLHKIVLIKCSLIYYIWIFFVARENKRWPYAFMDKLTNTQHAILYIFSSAVLIIFYEIAAFISNSIKSKLKKE